MRGGENIKDLAFLLGFNDKSNYAAFNVYRLVFDMRKTKRVERKDGKFATEYVIVKRRALGDYLIDELRKHDLELIDTAVSVCKKHQAFVCEDRDTKRIYDYVNCLVFESRQEYDKFKEAGVGGIALGCLDNLSREESILLNKVRLQEIKKKFEIQKKVMEKLFSLEKDPP